MINSKKYYKELLKDHELKKNYLKNMGQAFLFGGLLCLFGQFILQIFTWMDISKDDRYLYLSLVVITIAIILSAFGIYDRFGQIAKAGSYLPISGFANSMASSAIEYRPEGLTLGAAANTFKLAGSVIVFGSVSGFLVALIKWVVYLL